MTNQEICDLLVKIEFGYKASQDELLELKFVKSIEWKSINLLVSSIVLLENLKIADLSGADITDISLLSNIVGLEKLDLSNNQNLSDISPLHNLKNLTHLCLSGTRVEDISVFTYLKGLTYLKLDWRKVTDIGPLLELNSLVTLDISGEGNHKSSLTDISKIKELKALKELRASNTNIRDISCLSELINLNSLDLSYTDVSDITVLQKLIRLRKLNLRGTYASDIEVLSYLTELTDLDLAGNTSRPGKRQLKHLNALKGLKSLKVLHLDSTNISDISILSELKNLINLDLSGNGFWGSSLTDISALKGLIALENLKLDYTSVKDISSLKNLTNLTTLTLCRTQVSDISALSGLSLLKHVDLSWSKVSDICSLSYLKGITYLSLRGTGVEDIKPLMELRNLKILDLAETSVSEVCALSSLTGLTKLSLHKTNVSDISALSKLTEIQDLDLSETLVGDISPIIGFKSLDNLDLRGLTLKAIPESLLDLQMDVLRMYTPKKRGIQIEGLRLIEQPIEVFYQSKYLIDAFFESGERVPVNECKVIFIGDAESGKTLSVQRLLNNGNYVYDFDGNSTPGIEITVSSTTMEGSEIIINYWDFGGQEIQHSMHRMFLTERTVYVVFLNARQDPLDERAMYWLENINCFAPGAPVLLVINKIDQNRRPTFNQDFIINKYKNQIRGVVRMSALKDDPEAFLTKLQGGIDNIIKDLSSVKVLIPSSWKALMDSIRSMHNNYLTTSQFIERCTAFNIKNYITIHDELVDLLQVIGVSFCYYQNRSLADYMILNPRWLVNAIYTIITNSELASDNGVITQNDLYDLLQADMLHGISIKRVLPDLRYTAIEINYILGVIRMFRLSYQLRDGSEFFPMLCDGNEKISSKDAVSEDALHYIFRYIYLPANVMHRLIVDMQMDIDYRYVWYSGAIFRDKGQSQKAFAYYDRNDLHIFVESEEAFYNPNEYLMQFKKIIRNINKEMGLSAKEYVTYREGDKETEILFEEIKGSLDNGIFRYYDNKLGKVNDYRIVAHRYERNNPKIRSVMVQKIVEALGEMQNDPTYYRKASSDNYDLENSRNRFVSHLLRIYGQNCSDQQTGGISSSGKSIGVRDILIRDENNQDILIYEGINLKCIDKADISEHLGKLLNNYNPRGLPYGVLVTYLECGKEKFSGFVEHYKNCLKQCVPDSFEYLGEPVDIPVSEGQFLCCMEMSYVCGADKYFVIYHIIVRVAP